MICFGRYIALKIFYGYCSCVESAAALVKDLNNANTDIKSLPVYKYIKFNFFTVLFPNKKSPVKGDFFMSIQFKTSCL